MDFYYGLSVRVLLMGGYLLLCGNMRTVYTAPANDLPSNWKDLIGEDALNQQQAGINAQGESVFEGDIKGVDRKLAGQDPNAMSNAAHNAVMNRAQLWPNNVVPYQIGSGYNSQQKQMIEGALRDIMQKTCVKFVPRTNERDYIVYMNRNAGCSSYVARVGGQQIIDLQEGCLNEYGEVQHETMHALGFFHEQSRKDRDDYVTIVWSNIEKDNYDQFEKYQSNLLGLPYDYDSIMHYGWNYFAINRAQPTIVPKKKASIGNRKVMSSLDVQKINLLYQCSGAKSPSSSSNTGSGSRPSSSSSGSGSSGSRNRGSGSSIWDVLFGGGGSSNSGSSSWDEPATTRRPVVVATTSKSKESGGITGAISGFLKGLFG